MNLQLRRFSSGAQSTLGLLSIDGVFACFTLEDRQRDVKIMGETRIPAGSYAIRLQSAGRLHNEYATRFVGIHHGMLALQAVPNFTGVMIHCGNTDADTEGCILLGNGVEQNVTEAGNLFSSTAAYRRVYPLLADALQAGSDVTIEIVDEP